MDIGDYYSRAFKGFIENPKLAIPTLFEQIVILIITFLAMALLFFSVIGPEFLTTGKIHANSTDPIALIVPLTLFSITVAISSWIIGSYVSAATVGMSKSAINGEKPDLSLGFRNGNKYFLKIMAVSLIIGLILLFFTTPILIGFFVDYTYGITPALTLIGALVSLILWLVTMVLFIFTSQSIVVCGESVIGSLKDSFRVLRENIFDVIIVLIINTIIALCIGFVFGIINMALSLVPIVGYLLSIILQVILTCIINPFFVLVLTCVYMDKKGLIHPHLENPEHIPEPIN
ncbi:MAG TPA: hypothetical protein GX531_07100 [Methanothermobacter sp.]|nr:hypothetical protein [Methanothermobacter sp.]